MELLLTVESAFDAAHSSHRGEPSRAHGHHYRVSASTIEPGDWVLLDDLHLLTQEFDQRPVEDMLNGGRSDVCSMAANFLERLVMAHPGIVRVEVWESDSIHGSAARTKR